METAIILIILAVVTAVLIYFLRKSKPLTQEEQAAQRREVPDGCCGMHLTCVKDSLHSAVSTQIEYFDDEELDRLAHRDPESFTEAEKEELRDVLYTLREEEVAPWVRSIQLREIPLPQEIKDEVYMIVGEMRDHSALEHSLQH